MTTIYVTYNCYFQYAIAIAAIAKLFARMHPSFLLLLLQIICKAPAILTFRNFPDVILAGKQPLDREETRYLLAQGYLRETRHDSFGSYLELSEKAKILLQTKDVVYE